MKRYLEEIILDDLSHKMVFLWWPRQVWKTTFSKNLAENKFKSFQYLNWDNSSHRKIILSENFSQDSELLIFDEIHKMKNWKNFIKWLFDTKKEEFKFLITGSARLDLYRKWWDSMLWRYHYHRLHPVSLAEVSLIKNDFDDFEKNPNLNFKNWDLKKEAETLKELLKYWSFPETFLLKNERSLKRWHKERKQRLVREDIRDIHLIKEFSTFQILVDILESKVASIFSINSLREDLQVSNNTIKNWIEILENFYYCFRVYPYQNSKIKSLKKESKIFLWDYSEVKDIWAKTENLIASHLLKFTHYLEDSFWINVELRYLRDIEKREIDFVVIIDNEPIFAVEVKNSSNNISKNLSYFWKKLNLKNIYQVVFEENIDFTNKDWIRVISASKFLTAFV